MEHCDNSLQTVSVAPVASPDMESSQSLKDSEAAGAWSFSALIRGTEWDPSLFTSVLNERASSTLKTTLDIASILSYACSDRGTVVPAGYVSVEGYLKLNGSAKVKHGTLRRRLQHPDLSSVEWTACLVGRRGRYTDHDFIKKFHRETALPPAGVLQRSADAVGPRLRVDFLGPSDAPLNRGGWAARQARQAAANEGAAGAGAPAVAPPAAPAPSPAAAAGAGGAAPPTCRQRVPRTQRRAAWPPRRRGPRPRNGRGSGRGRGRARPSSRRRRQAAASLMTGPRSPPHRRQPGRLPARALRSRLARTRRPAPHGPLPPPLRPRHRRGRPPRLEPAARPPPTCRQRVPRTQRRAAAWPPRRRGPRPRHGRGRGRGRGRARPSSRRRRPAAASLMTGPRSPPHLRQPGRLPARALRSRLARTLRPAPRGPRPPPRRPRHRASPPLER